MKGKIRTCRHFLQFPQVISFTAGKWETSHIPSRFHPSKFPPKSYAPTAIAAPSPDGTRNHEPRRRHDRLLPSSAASHAHYCARGEPAGHRLIRRHRLARAFSVPALVAISFSSLAIMCCFGLLGAVPVLARMISRKAHHLLATEPAASVACFGPIC